MGATGQLLDQLDFDFFIFEIFYNETNSFSLFPDIYITIRRPTTTRLGAVGGFILMTEGIKMRDRPPQLKQIKFKNSVLSFACRFFGMRVTHQPSPWISDYGNFIIKATLVKSVGKTDDSGQFAGEISI